MIANRTTVIAPTATGKNTKLKLFPPNITIMGLAPAGGCVVFVIIIIKIASATPAPIVMKDSPNNV